jgi:hypothetical protein
MALQLLFEDRWAIPVEMDARLREALDLQHSRTSRSETGEDFVARLSTCISAAVAACLDSDLQLPTPNQIRYATDIARELGVALPADALRYRGATTDFIGRFAEAFRDVREQRRRPVASSPSE